MKRSDISNIIDNESAVLIPLDRYRVLMSELRSVRAELSNNSRRIAQVLGEIADYAVNKAEHGYEAD